MHSHPQLRQFEKSLYLSRNIYLIPKGQRKEADIIAREIFVKYIEKYKEYGLTEDNAVTWLKSGLPGFVANKVLISDLENKWNTWRIRAFVEADNGTHNESYGCFLPPYVVAYHELMHVEETPKGVIESFHDQSGHELLTTLKTIILLDQVYKMINQIDLDQVVNYHINIDVAGNQISIGFLANLYRKHEEEQGSLAKALISQASLQFLATGGKCEYSQEITEPMAVDDSVVNNGQGALASLLSLRSSFYSENTKNKPDETDRSSESRSNSFRCV
jgi:hypothetical protein